ncbi:MAG: hypothetical protein ABIX01_01570 [Chitinophagaceae bacterium]
MMPIFLTKPILAPYKAASTTKMMIPTSKQLPLKYAWLFFILLIGLIAWCANPWQLYFLNDDFIHIPKAYDGTIGHNNGLRHICDLSLYIDSLMSKQNAFGYHLTNLLLHTANMLLMVPLAKKLAATLGYPISTQVALLIAGLFGVYAFHSEAVFWILCRTASLSLFFNLLCWLCFFRAMTARLWILPMVLFFLLGIFTYESLWVYPFWLLAWFFLLPKGSVDKALSKWPIAVTWIVFIAYFPVRLKITGALLGTYEAGDVEHFNPLALVEKTSKLFMRSFLPPIENIKLFAVLFGAAMLGVLWLALLLLKRKLVDKLLLFFILAWLISYYPYVSMGVSVTGYESERYLYYPSLFLCAGLVYAGVLLWQKNGRALMVYLSALFLFHIFFLVKAAEVFKEISGYSREAIAAISKLQPSKKLVIKNLPVYSNGLPVFNYGFMNAMEWFSPGRDTLQVEVESRQKFDKEVISVSVNSSNSVADTVVFTGK